MHIWSLDFDILPLETHPVHAVHFVHLLSTPDARSFRHNLNMYFILYSFWAHFVYQFQVYGCYIVLSESERNQRNRKSTESHLQIRMCWFLYTFLSSYERKRKKDTETKEKRIQIVDKIKLKAFHSKMLQCSENRIDLSCDINSEPESIEMMMLMLMLMTIIDGKWMETTNERKCERKSEWTKKLSIDSAAKENNFFNGTSYATLDYDKWISALMNFPLSFFSPLLFFGLVLFVLLYFAWYSALRRTPKFQNQLHSYSQSLVTDAIRSILVVVQFLLRRCCSLRFILWTFNDSSLMWFLFGVYVRFIFAQVKLSVVMKQIIAITKTNREQHKRQEQQQQHKISIRE